MCNHKTLYPAPAATLELLVATQDGVLRTDTNGLITPECVDNSQGASGECPGDLGDRTCQLCPLCMHVQRSLLNVLLGTC